MFVQKYEIKKVHRSQEQSWIQDFPEVGAPTCDFAKISQKLQEIERI